MLKKIKTLLAAFKIINADIIIAPMIDTTQQDPEVAQRIKRVRKMFKEQEASLNARALKPHSCIDPLSCRKSKCWKWEPDKVGSLQHEVESAEDVTVRTARNRDLLDKMK